MMPIGATMQTRRAPSSHRPWKPHGYQQRAVQFLLGANAAALWMSPGMGKTSCVLAAFAELLSRSSARRALVIAPLRVCQTVWRQEAAKWSELRHLRFSLLHGAKKVDRLKDDADIWLINPEGVQWLCAMYAGRSLPFDTLVVDELTKFKNSQAERHKAIRPRLRGIQRRFGLTGTPAPNGYMDLFGQFLILDDGAALGKYITHYRDNYFQADYNGFDYVLQPGGAKRIERRIEPYVLTLRDEDYLQMPPLVPHVIPLEMSKEQRKLYNKMKNDMLVALPGGVVTGANAAAVYVKLKQMANGAVYMGDAKNTVAHLHDTKLEALDDLLEELDGEQLLLAYEFNHDKDRLRLHYGDKITFFEGNEAKTQALVDQWNRGEIRFLACHPASAGHGLNLQGSSCAHVAWFCPIWDYELFDQFIRRIRRQGNEAQRIVNHILVMTDSIDEIALQALSDKDTTQGRLVKALNSEFLQDGEAPASGAELERQERLSNMVLKLGRQTDAAQSAPVENRTTAAFQPQPAAQPQMGASKLPAGWGGSVAQPNPEEAAQRERVAAQLQGQSAAQPMDPGTNPAQGRALSAFSGAVQTAHAAIATAQPVDVTTAPEADTAPAKRTRTRKTDPAPEGPFRAGHDVRLGALRLAVEQCDGGSLDDALELAKQFLEFVEGE